MLIHDLTLQLSTALSLPTLELQESGVCGFALDAVSITLNAHRSGTAFTLRTVVGQLSDANFIEPAERLLAANLATGPSMFAMDPQGNVYLTEYFKLADLNFEQFLRALERFVSLAEHWQGLLAPAAATTEGAQV